ncbi:MAG: hypothetical protein AAFR81_21125 [Chloroflexota bacterium]
MRGFGNNLSFMFLWILGWLWIIVAGLLFTSLGVMVSGTLAIALWVQEEQFLVRMDFLLLFALLMAGLVGLLIGITLGIVQKRILRRYTDDAWGGWVIASSIGGALGMVVLVLLMGRQLTTSILLLTVPSSVQLFWLGLQVSILPLSIVAIVQMFVLWRVVRGAWTWVLANTTAGIVLFSLIAFSGVWRVAPLFSIPAVVFIACTPGIVTGFAMVWLLAFNRRHG